MNSVIAQISRTHYKTALTSGKHDLLGDEPAPHGGDLGPTPYDYLLMALGSCVAMTVRMYADRKGWDLESVEVQLNQERVHSKDCEKCASDQGFIHKVEKVVKLTGTLDEDQRRRLVEIADKCPVHKTLTNEIVIQSRDYDAAG